MTESTDITEAPETQDVEATEAVETATETEAPEAREPREPVIIDRPIQTVGRRKEAVVRVRLVPGTGQFNLDGRSLEAYFPNKVHQQLIKAPLVTVDRVDAFDIYAHLDGGGPSGQAGALRLAISRALGEALALPPFGSSGRFALDRLDHHASPLIRQDDAGVVLTN